MISKIRICLILTAAALPLLAQTGDPYAELLRYQWNQPRTAIAAIEGEMRGASPEKLREVESKLLQILQAPEASTAAKAYTCRMLRFAASEQSIPVLTSLLTDKDLSADAQFALRNITSSKVDQALREALPKAQGLQKAGIIQTLGARGDRQAVSLIAPLTSDTDSSIAEAALYAFGQMGGTEALKVLQNVKVAKALENNRQHAMLCCAEKAASEGQKAAAWTALQWLYAEAGSPALKTAALRGISAVDQGKAVPVLVSALKSDNAKLRKDAARIACESGELNPDLFSGILTSFSSMPAEVQTMILEAARGKAILPMARLAAKSEAEPVRLAALGALGRLGEAGDTELLMSVAVSGKSAEQTAARQSLQLVRNRQVDEVLLKYARRGEPAWRAEAIRVLASRNTTAALPVVLAGASDGDKSVRVESLKALAVLADAQTLPQLVRTLAETKSAEERSLVEDAIVAVTQRAADRDSVIEPLVRGLAGRDVEVRCALLRVLAQTQSTKALNVLREAAKDADAKIRDAAVRGLANWSDPIVLPDLSEICRKSDDSTQKVLALRGYIRLAAQAGEKSAEQGAKLLAEALKLASNAGEKKQALAALGGLKHRSALEPAIACLGDKDVELEAASAVVQVSKSIRNSDRVTAKAAIQKVLDTCKTPAARQLAESATPFVDAMTNIAPRGVASSPDGWERDGTAGGDQSGIDDNLSTYWDEEDGKELYRYVVTFKQPEKMAAISIVGWEHHKFAPKTFEILCDGKSVKKVTNAQYDNNFLAVPLEETTCKAVELKITGFYGASPAIRELGIYAPGGKMVRTDGAK